MTLQLSYLDFEGLFQTFLAIFNLLGSLGFKYLLEFENAAPLYVVKSTPRWAIILIILLHFVVGRRRIIFRVSDAHARAMGLRESTDKVSGATSSRFNLTDGC